MHIVHTNTRFRHLRRLFALPPAAAATVAAVLASAMLLTACASSPKGPALTGNPYYDDNIGDFSTLSLSNGIPVIFKQQEGKTAWVGLVITGGVSLYPPEKSGLEDITLSMMLHGSESYPYQEIQRIAYDKSLALSSSAGKDYSLISARFITRDTSAALSLLTDSVLHPLLSTEDFTKVMTEEAEAVQRTLTNPSGILGLELSKSAFKNHPYATSVSPTADTISTITLEDVRNHYESLLNAARFSFVVVGDFTGRAQKQVLELLEAGFGSIGRNELSLEAIPPLAAENGAVYASCEIAADTGYIAGYFACPERSSDDYVAFALALMYLDDIMFRQVREQHSAVYTIGSGVLGGKQLLGAISVYKATEKQHLKEYIYEAIDSFPDEKEIAESLDYYKNKYITALFTSSQNTGGVAGNVVASLVYNNSPTQYLNRSAQVQAVTAQDIVRVYSRYLAQKPERAENKTANPIRWIVVSGEKSVRQFKFD
ncbi:MAG: insulinase family protein [Treponema sp.]|nr:insulinase family protein [Treponema sp.]